MRSALSSPGLYARLLKDSWDNLPSSLRWAHSRGEKRGTFNITLGRNWIARRLAALSGMPVEGKDVPTILEIREREGKEVWNRQFHNQHMMTIQWQKGAFLVERFQIWELLFVLHVLEDGINYTQVGARLCLWLFCIPWPLWLAPRVSAREAGFTESRVTVVVTVKLPAIGTFIKYEGSLTMPEV